MADSEEEKESEFVPEDEVDEGPGLIKKLRERLKKAVEEKQEYLEGWQRARADFANYKREEAGIHSGKEERVKAELIEVLLPALDALEMSLKHGASKETALVEKQFTDVLKKIGVEKFGAPSEIFDPHRYEALQEIATKDEKEDHTVASVHRAGYKAGERIIRPAQVSVNVFKQ